MKKFLLMPVVALALGGCDHTVEHKVSRGDTQSYLSVDNSNIATLELDGVRQDVSGEREILIPVADGWHDVVLSSHDGRTSSRRIFVQDGSIRKISFTN